MGKNTTNLNLYKPDTNEINWGDLINQNWDLIDSNSVAKQSKSEKGQLNGYASLDSVGNVPFSQLGNQTVINFADNEAVAGSGTAWTLLHVPNPAGSLILVQYISGYGGIVLVQGIDFTLSFTAVTTTNSLSAGVLRAWYRY